MIQSEPRIGSSPRIILADDFTGAADAAVHFASAGQRTALILDPAALPTALPGHQAAALSTESRLLSPAAAEEMVGHITASAVAAGGSLFFKKIDSTLRGNPGAEIAAALAAASLPAALVCPASPATGRTVRDGILFVNGIPLPDSGMGRDPVNPVPTGSVAEVLAMQTALPRARLGLTEVRSGPAALRRAAERLLAGGVRLIVPDAENGTDLLALAGLLRDLPALLPAGAAGLAEAIAAGFGKAGEEGGTDGTAAHEKRAVCRLPAGTRILAVAGSLTAETREQVKCATESGVFFPLPLAVAGDSDPAAQTERLVRMAAEAGGGRHLLLVCARPPEAGVRVAAADAERAAGLFARAAARLAEAEKCGLVYATGGSTAVRVAAELGVESLILRREIAPGVVLSECAGRYGIGWFVTKAGGFGTPETLVRLAETAGRTPAGAPRERGGGG